MNIYKLKGVIQNYAWGGTGFIPSLLGLEVTDVKLAEYWMGAHNNAPSIIQDLDTPLNDYIQIDPSGTLGEQVASRFGRLPFLFKVLDVKDMLSIQVHPTKEEAEKGFKKENKEGIPLSAPNRNYKDDNHKPEIMVALSEFWLLHGFKPAAELIQTLQTVSELSHLIPIFKKQGYKGLYKSVMEESNEKTSKTLTSLFDRILPIYDNEDLPKDGPEFWAARAFKAFCKDDKIDKGIYSIFFFNIVKLHNGEGIFQDAGVPHAYLEGQNIELMANSDNVLRGGLTPKHVDVSELLKHVSFKETVPEVLRGETIRGRNEMAYKSPVKDFELSAIKLEAGASYEAKSDTLEIIILLAGEVNILSEDKSLAVKKGEVFLVTANSNYSITANMASSLYKAYCPFLI